MFRKGSRYQKARLFDVDEHGAEVFSGIRPREIESATGVLEHVIQAGDRLDLLARHYYNDDRQWFRIVDANPEFSFGPDMLGPNMVGRVILIPKLKE